MAFNGRLASGHSLPRRISLGVLISIFPSGRRILSYATLPSIILCEVFKDVGSAISYVNTYEVGFSLS